MPRGFAVGVGSALNPGWLLVSEAVFYPSMLWTDPCKDCGRNVICNDDGLCKRCLNPALWAGVDNFGVPTGVPEVPLEELSVVTPGRPARRCVQCGARQEEAPGQACKHHAWHDLPAPAELEESA